MLIKLYVRRILSTLAFIGLAATAQAQQGDIILTLTGITAADGTKVSATYDLAMLQALPKTSFSTTTMWTQGVQSFDGV